MYWLPDQDARFSVRGFLVRALVGEPIDNDPRVLRPTGGCLFWRGDGLPKWYRVWRGDGLPKWYRGWHGVDHGIFPVLLRRSSGKQNTRARIYDLCGG